jgi:nitroreductase
MSDTKATIAFLRNLRNTRDFLPTPIPDPVLADILEVGRWTGTASNRQSGEIVVVRDAAAKGRLTEYGANTAVKAAAALVIVTPGDPERAEHEMFDEGRLAERLQLAAAAHGLGAGVAWLKGEGPAAAKQMLGIPPEKRIRTVVAIGYPDPAAPGRPKPPEPRKPLNTFAHWERF